MDITAKWLQSIEALHEVPLEQLQWLLDNSSLIEVKQDEYLFKTGEEIRGTYIVTAGGFRICMKQGGELREIARFKSQDITGYLPFSRGNALNAFGQALSDTECLLFPRESLEEMTRTQFELTQALVHIMTSRVRNLTSRELLNEKMMALGKLSAGLAHELNNPSAAIVRGSDSLLKHLKLAPETFQKIMGIKVSAEAVSMVSRQLFEILSREEKPLLTMMQRSSREDSLLDWMEEYQVENAQEVAENFVDFGFSLEDLGNFRQIMPREAISPVFNWMNNNLVTEKMVQDIGEASRRIATLVGSVKAFTHMDQGEGKQYADIHSGILNTLKMLQYKIGQGKITVDQDFDNTLPQVNALMGELNQVWTNLIDNALDAMEANRRGVLQIKTGRDNDEAVITITDNGTGIPGDVQSFIFDPFFTTKEVGKGTGLGLDIVSRIVKHHGGSVKVTSGPGKTEFTVKIPINGN